MNEDLGQELLNAGFNNIDIDNLDKEAILQEKIYVTIFTITDALERTNLIVKLQERAKKIGVIRSFEKLLKAYQQDYIQKSKQQGSNIVKVTNPPLQNLKCGKWCVDDFRCV